MSQSPGQQAFLYQKNNALLNATIEAAVSPSGKSPLVYPASKQGNGNIRLQGNYDGLIDAAYDIQIADTAFTNPVVSAPVFRGAGTGKITDIEAVGLDAQKIIVLCQSTGVTTQSAEVEIEGVRFRAKSGGAAGNTIYITVDDSPLVFIPTDYSTLKDLRVGDTALEGQEWDWDTKVILGDIIPETAHRVAFGADRLHIHLQYKKFENGVYKYYFVPAIRYAVKAGTKVYFATEGRTVTVTDGVTSEEYTGIVTIADFWTAVKALPSALIEPVTGSIDTSRTPSSPAVRELAIRTDAYALPTYRSEKSSEYAGDLTGIVVDSDTKTELIEVKCVDNTFIGKEKWTVKGSSSGDLGQALTGDANDFGPVTFTIPTKLPDDISNIENWSHKVNYETRPTGTTPPPICFAMRLGINSQPQTLTLTYTEKPANCFCPPVTFNERYLGYDEEGGEIGTMYTIEDLIFWTDAVSEIMKEQYSLVEFYEGRKAQSVMTASNFDAMTREAFENFKKLASRLMALPEDETADLVAMLAQYKALVYSLELKLGMYASGKWAPGIALVAGWRVIPSSPNGYLYQATITGTTGGTEPTWPTTIGQTVVDGTVTWLCVSTDLTSADMTWDDINSEWTGLPDLPNTTITDVRYDVAEYVALTEAILLYEKTYGLKKNSVTSYAGVPYQDDPSAAYWWEISGARPYLPAFTGIEFYSVIRSGDIYINTKEFAFHISVPCGGTLMKGDKIIVTIGNSKVARTYQVGDITYLPTVKAQNLYLAGGIDGDDTYIFSVQGGIDSFANCLLDRDNPLPYSNNGLSFQLTDGIILFRVGDQFEFNIEGGHFKWRKDGGAWSELISIAKEFQTLDSGLEIAFDFGVSPSFVTDDAWEVLAVQENRAENMVAPWAETRYKGTGDIVFSFAAPVTIDSLIIDMHTIPGTITLQASNDSGFDPLIYEDELQTAELTAHLFEAVIEEEYGITAQYFRLVITGEVEIGYVFLGSMMRLTVDADNIVPTRRFNMTHQEGIEPGGVLKYKRIGLDIQYSSFIYNADFEQLDELIDYLKSLNNMPFYIIPNTICPHDAVRAWIDTDIPDIGSDIDMNNPKDNRIYTVKLPLTGLKKLTVA